MWYTEHNVKSPPPNLKKKDVQFGLYGIWIIYILWWDAVESFKTSFLFQVRLQEYSDYYIIWKKGSFLKKDGQIALLQQTKWVQS